MFGQGNTKAIANNVCEIRIGPVPPRQTWKVRRYSIQTSGIDSAECYVYDNCVGENHLIDSTFSGVANQGTLEIDMQAGDTIIFRWQECVTTAGFAAPTATANIRYDLEVQ